MPDRPYSAGETAPATGLYQVVHDSILPSDQRHRPAHLVIVVEGEPFRPCNRCGQAVLYRLVAEGIHLLHDWDFTGPPELLVAKPLHHKRRSFARCRLEIPVSVRTGDSGAKLSARLHDLSEAGLAATLQADLQVDDLVAFEFKLPGDLSLSRVSGRLRYRQGRRYGFQFVRQTAAQRAKLRAFCRKHDR